MSEFEWHVGPATTAARILEGTSEELSREVPAVKVSAFWRSQSSVVEAFGRMEQLRAIIADESGQCAQSIRLASERFIHCDQDVADRVDLMRQEIRDASQEAWGW